MNRLIEAGQSPPPDRGQPPEDGRDGVLNRLQALIDHLRRHLATEEAFLQSIGYPGICEHKSEHALLLAELVDLHRDLERCAAERIGEDSLELIRDWVLHHVVAEDRHFAWYYYRRIGATRQDAPQAAHTSVMRAPSRLPAAPSNANSARSLA